MYQALTHYKHAFYMQRLYKQSFALYKKIIILFYFLCLCYFALFSFSHAQVADSMDAVQGSIIASQKKGYARMIFSFSTMPKYKLRDTGGVIVLEFDRQVFLNFNENFKIPDYVLAKRIDPDGRAIRMALKNKWLVNMQEAGNKLVVDLLTPNWQGLKPSLPKEILQEIIDKAAINEKRLQELRLGFESGRPSLKMRAGHFKTFSRFIFDWDRPVKVQLSHDENVLLVKFNSKFAPEITEFKQEPPKYINKINHFTSDNQLVFRFEMEANTSVRGFSEGYDYILDFSNNAQSIAQKDTGISVPTTAEKETISAPDIKIVSDTDTETVKIVSKKPPSEYNTQPPNNNKKKAQSNTLTQDKPLNISQMKTVTTPIAQKDKPSYTPIQIENKNINFNSNNIIFADTDIQGEIPPLELRNYSLPGFSYEKIQAQNDGNQTQKNTLNPIVVTSDILNTDKQSDDKKIVYRNEIKDVVIPKIMRSGGEIFIRFPFDKPTPSAAFQRNSKLWLIFDTNAPIDIKKIERALSDKISSIGQTRTAKSAVLLFNMKKKMLSSVKYEGNNWIIALGEKLLTVREPIFLRRMFRGDGFSDIEISMKNPSSIHRLTDPFIGDDIAVVTAFGPQQGILKTQEFVEFQALKTSHGAAIKLFSDDVTINNVKGRILISRNEGLNVSIVGKIDGLASSPIKTTRLGFVDFEAWKYNDIVDFKKHEKRLFRDISKTKGSESVNPRLALIRLYIANNLSVEAVAHLEILKKEYPDIITNLEYKFLNGIAKLMLERLKEADAIFNDKAFKKNIDINVWRALLKTKQRQWREAQLNFEKANAVITAYPNERQAQFRLMAARAGFGVNDIGFVEEQISLFPKANLPKKLTAHYKLIKGMLAEKLGKQTDALKLYNEVLRLNVPKISTEAEFYFINLQLQLKKLTPEEALKKMEILSFVWRGDNLEMQILKRIATINWNLGQYAKSLSILKNSYLLDPDTQEGRNIQDVMMKNFASLYLHGLAEELSPMEALYLYYEFKELTPVGREGDEMIRNLVDRLVDVDLLDQAEEMLQYQISERLNGAAKAQVAAKLAGIHLRNRKPERALLLLRKTQLSNIPEFLRKKRIALKIRAMSDLGQIETAMELVKTIDGYIADNLKANLLWKQEKWLEAGEAYEKILGEAWSTQEPLTKEQRYHVLRAALSYTLSRDELSVSRLQEKFGAKIALSEDARIFDTLVKTGGIGNSTTFRNLAAQIASMNTTDAFLRSLNNQKSLDPNDIDRINSENQN